MDLLNEQTPLPQYRPPESLYRRNIIPQKPTNTNCAITGPDKQRKIKKNPDIVG